MKNNILACLNCAALALLSLDAANAGRVEETYNADFQYGHYSESGSRIDANVFEGVLAVPLGKALTASVNVVSDVISGASPTQNMKNAKGGITQIISGASQYALKSGCGSSICEQRDAVNPSLTYFFDNASVNLGGGFSEENDYTSRYFNTNLSVDFNKKLTTLNVGGSVAFDEVSPVNFNGDCNPKCSKTSQQYLLGVSQIINKDSLLQSNVTLAYHHGYLSDPYKSVVFYDTRFQPFAFNGLLFGSSARDTRPRDKFQGAWLTQYIRHFGQLNDAALHVDYRFSVDDWGVNSHTTEFSWHQPIVAGWQVIPRFRYYSQDAADFYAPVFNGNLSDFTVYSSDYRLAGFGALSGGIKISKELTELHSLHQLKFQAGIEYYDHKAAYQWGGDNLGPFADFSYYLVTASINLKF
ncbi:MAG: DUF3570 domain-containing protein [Methylovulum sp.]|nr:DUF3570 domain-containing protein [Methylovulum sp.]